MAHTWNAGSATDRLHMPAPEVTLVGLVAVVVAAIVGAAAWFAVQAYDAALEATEGRNTRLVQAMDDAAGRFFRQLERQATRIGSDYLHARPGLPAGLTGLRRQLGDEDTPGAMAVGVVGADGRVASVSEARLRPLLEAVVAAESDRFAPAAELEATSLFILRPAAESVLPPAPVLLGWRIAGSDGGFAVVVHILDTTRLRAMIGGPVGGAGATIGLVTTDGDLLFQNPVRDGSPLGDSVRAALDRQRLAESNFGTYRTGPGPEVVDALVAFHRVGRFPVNAVAVSDVTEVLRPWRSLTLAGMLTALGLSLAVGVLAAVHIRAVGRNRRDVAHRVRERTLEETRAAERLLAAERLTHIGHWDHDLIAGTGHWSAEIYRILGLAPEAGDLDLARVLAAIHPDDRDDECTARILASAGVKPYDARYRLLRADGMVRFVHAQAEVLRDDRGEPIKLIGTILDVTDLVDIEERLTESEERYRKIFEASQDALLLIDRADGTIVDANAAAAIIYGWDRGDLAGMTWSALLGPSAPQDRPLHRRRDGSLFHADLTESEAELNNRMVRVVAVRDITARVEAEERLAVVTSRLTEAERIAGLGYWDWDHRARIHHWSEGQWRILGLEPGQVRPGYGSFKALVHRDDRERVGRFAAALGGVGGDSGALEFRVVRPDGQCRHFQIIGRIRRDDSGAILRMFAILMDITERKRFEIATAESHAALLSAINATREDSVMLIGADGTIQIANERAARDFGTTALGLTGANLFSLVPGEACQRWRLTVTRVIESGRPVRFEHTRGGTVYDTHLSPASNHAGRLVGVALFERDITARKHAESSLRLLTRVIEQSPLSVIITDRGGRIEYVNPHFAASTGYLPDEVIGKDPSLFKSGYTTPSEYRKLWEIISCGKIWQGEFHNRMKNGELHWESASIGPVRDDDGLITHFVAVKEDITRRKLAEIELLAAKERAEAASIAKSQFLATISHELRTPLNAILGFSEIIREGAVSGADSETVVRFADHARHIHSNGTHLLGLINDLLDLAKIEAGKFQLLEQFVDIEDVVSQALDMVRSRAEAGRLQLGAECPPGLPLIRADDRAMRHILINLLSNAVKFTPEGGSVSVRVLVDESRLMAVAVSDTGIGMSPEDIPKALEPFGQIDNELSRRHDGTGLGLPLCRSLVEAHGGHLEIESAPGAGTTVTVRLPRDRIVDPANGWSGEEG